MGHFVLKRCSMPATMIHRVLLPFVLTISVLSGCASQPKEEPPVLSLPGVAVGMTHYTGSPLSGAMARAVVGRDVDSLQVLARVVTLQSTLPDALEPFPARLIVSQRGGVPVRASAQLTLSARAGTNEQVQALEEALSTKRAGLIQTIGEFRGALPAGVTSSIDLISDQTGRGEGTRDMRVALHRASESVTRVQATLVLMGMVDEEPVEQEDVLSPSNGPTNPPVRKILQRELAVMDAIDLGGGRYAVVAPVEFAQSDARAVAVLIEVRPGSADPEHVEAVVKMNEQLRMSSAQAATRPTVVPGTGAVWPRFASAIRALDQPEHRRGALAFISGESGASLAEDLALVADDATLEQFVQRVMTEVTGSKSWETPEAIGWLLEGMALTILAEAQASETLSPELTSVLLVHTGEAGRHESSLDELRRRSSSPADLRNRIVAENMIYLEDASPAARVRAFDWLKARDLAPVNFDPLGPVTARRQALEKAQVQPPAQGPAPLKSNEPNALPAVNNP